MIARARAVAMPAAMIAAISAGVATRAARAAAGADARAGAAAGAEAIATEVAVNARIEVKLTTGPDGKPRLDVGAPTTYVDVLDENVEGPNTLSNAQFEAITWFALARVIAAGSGAVGAIPLPSFGGVAMRD